MLYYLDHGAYASVLGTAPTWGVPQDGDGTAKTAATASSIASVAFASVPASGSITVCGVSVSTTGVIGAASVNAAADALANNINATTTGVAATVAAALPQLNNLVFARGPTNGAPAGTCQLMMRIGSADLNHASNSNVGIVTTFSAAPTITQFAGGSGGCWGYFVNAAAMGVSNSIGIGTYGAWLHMPYVRTVPNVADTIYVRTGGGASKSISVASAQYTTVTMSHAAYDSNHVFDTNTIWTGDSATGQLKLTLTINYSSEIRVNVSATDKTTSWRCLRRGGFEIECVATTGTRLIVANGINGKCYGYGVTFRDSGDIGVNVSPFPAVAENSTNCALRLENCDYIVTTARTTIRPIFPTGAYLSNGSQAAFTGCTFDYNISGVSDPGDLVTPPYASNTEFVLSFDRCRFLGFASGFKLRSSSGGMETVPQRWSITAENCSGLALPSNYMGLPTATLFRDPNQHVFQISSINSTTNPSFRIENTRGIAEFLQEASPAFPTLSATFAGSGIPYSMRLIWLQSVKLWMGAPYYAPMLRMFNQQSTAVRTLTVELLVPPTVTGDVFATFGYIDNTGAMRSQTAFVLAASTASWTNSASYPTFVSRKLSITTEYPVATNSEVTAQVWLGGVAPATTVNVYVDPEFTVS